MLRVLAVVAEMAQGKAPSLHPGPIRSEEAAGTRGDIHRRKRRALSGWLVSSFHKWVSKPAVAAGVEELCRMNSVLFAKSFCTNYSKNPFTKFYGINVLHLC